MKKTLHSKYKDQAKLNYITEALLENIDFVYDYFDTSFRKGQRLYFSKCFIHGGDNKSSLNLYYNADYRVHYKCRTHECEKKFGSSLISMVRGGLSHIKYDWKISGDKEVSFDQTIDFILDKLNLNYGNIKGKAVNTTGYEFSKIVNGLVSSRPTGEIDKDFYRSRVDIPAQYFLQRGYSIETLDDFDVGTCKTYGKPFFNRAVVPVYDEHGKGILGFTARSIFEECKKCKSYHDPNKQCYNFPKWRNNSGFEKEKILYNYHKALPFVRETGVVILVESPGNTWRLAEAGINNVFGLLGATLTSDQKSLLDESGALTVILLLDNDSAGKEAAQKIKEQLERSYRTFILETDKNDIGDMNVLEVEENILPLINNIINI